MMKKPTVGIADTMFSRVDMARFAVDTIKKKAKNARIERYTVPGIKDLPVACKKLIEEHGCDIVLALGWVGRMPVDEVCASEASTGLINVQIVTNTHVLQIFVHSNEAGSEKELYEIAKDRTVKHALNALALLEGKTALTKFAGKGKRQGHGDAGPLRKGREL